ncbi:hypothetical protein KSP39_PZI020628 [Platanthera zijinensis]|uniref:Integrase catalytic domain-containing protein n=1 Tax=Platanthera zijinensis TaxID=2320716 RepID=A0AAP0AZ86_9ASPA
MDFITCFPRSQGYDCLLVVVVRLSKYRHFIPVKHPYTMSSVARIFVGEIVHLHGIPQSIGTKLRFNTAYHPQSNGQTEVLNRCVGTYLRCFATEQPRQWTQWVAWAELWYNTNYQSAEDITPFRRFMGGQPHQYRSGSQGSVGSKPWPRTYKTEMRPYVN